MRQETKQKIRELPTKTQSSTSITQAEKTPKPCLSR